MFSLSLSRSSKMSVETSTKSVFYEPSIPPKGKNWWTDVPYSPIIFNERFAYDLDTAEVNGNFLKYVRPVTKEIKESSGFSKVMSDKNLFRIELTIDSFEMEELKVKVVDDFITVKGHHKGREEGDGVVSRTFTRLYQLPRECKGDDITTVFTKEGTLIIEAPKQEVKAAPIYKIRREPIS